MTYGPSLKNSKTALIKPPPRSTRNDSRLFVIKFPPHMSLRFRNHVQSPCQSSTIQIPAPTFLPHLSASRSLLQLSLAFGLDGISVIVLQKMSNKAATCLLNILDDICATGVIPESWKQYYVIPIPKPNTFPTAYRPIALSSALCKIVEYIIKIRLDWFLEKNN